MELAWPSPVEFEAASKLIGVQAHGVPTLTEKSSADPAPQGFSQVSKLISTDRAPTGIVYELMPYCVQVATS